MKSVLVQLMLLVMVASGAAASKWEPHGTTKEGAKCYYKPAGMVQDKGVVRVWEKNAGTKAEMEQGIAEARRLTELDCEGQKYKTLMTVTYPTDMSQELIVTSHEGEWLPLVPDSAQSSLSRVLCTKRQPGAGAQEAGAK